VPNRRWGLRKLGRPEPQENAGEMYRERKGRANLQRAENIRKRRLGGENDSEPTNGLVKKKLFTGGGAHPAIPAASPGFARTTRRAGLPGPSSIRVGDPITAEDIARGKKEV